MERGIKRSRALNNIFLPDGESCIEELYRRKFLIITETKVVFFKRFATKLTLHNVIRVILIKNFRSFFFSFVSSFLYSSIIFSRKSCCLFSISSNDFSCVFWISKSSSRIDFRGTCFEFFFASFCNTFKKSSSSDHSIFLTLPVSDPKRIFDM